MQIELKAYLKHSGHRTHGLCYVNSGYFLIIILSVGCLKTFYTWNSFPWRKQRGIGREKT